MHVRRYFQVAILIAAAGHGGPAAAQGYYGTGSETTGAFPLSAGRLTLELEHEGAGQFVVRIAEQEGGWSAAVVDTTGPYVGRSEIEIPHGGDYRLDVIATARWMVRLETGESSDSVSGSRAPDEMRTQGRFDAGRTARRLGGTPYLIGGLVGGALLGPIGAGVAFGMASGREARIPDHVEQDLAGASPVYAAAFREAFPEQLRSARKASAVIGGVTGSVVFFFLLVQIANWDSDGGSPGPGPGPGLP